MGYAFLAVALVFNACANMLIKTGAADFASLRTAGLAHAVFANYALMGGLVLFALNVVFYALALSRIPLSVGYPVMTAGGLLIITAFSALYLRESVGMLQMFGILLLIIGIVFVVQQ